MLQSMGSQRVGQDLVTEQQQQRQNWSSVDSTGRSDKPDVRFMLEFHLSYYFPLGIFFFSLKEARCLKFLIFWLNILPYLDIPNLKITHT